jgi:hypothetical protein
MVSTRVRSRAHMAWVTSQDCAVCGRGPRRIAIPCHGRVEAHHVRTGQVGGMGLKPSDADCVPLCRAHHSEGHARGWPKFEAIYEVDLRFLARELAVLSPVLTGVPEPS